MSATEFDDVDDFLGYTTRGGGGDYLSNWKEDGSIDVVLHPKSKLVVNWSHPWFRVVEVEDKESGDKSTKIRRTRFNSMERPAVLKKQTFRLKDGSREVPPQICPFSFLLEWVREQISEGQISWTDKIFRFESDDDDMAIHAGGFTGMFNKRKVTEKEVKQLKTAGINRKEAFKENCSAKAAWIFRVFSLKDPESCVIATESDGLGKKMQKAIRDRIEDLEEKGDPFKYPVVFRWKYDEDEEFDRKFDVKAMTSVEIPEVIEAQFEDEPPSIEDQIKQSNIAILRASFEKHWIHKVVPPWEEIFEKAATALKGTDAVELPEDFNEHKKTRARDEDESSDDEDQSSDDEDEELYACDHCDKPMPAVATCPHCGAKYDDEGKMIEKPQEKQPEPEKRKTRAEAAAAKAAAEKPKTDDEEIGGAKPSKRARERASSKEG